MIQTAVTRLLCISGSIGEHIPVHCNIHCTNLQVSPRLPRLNYTLLSKSTGVRCRLRPEVFSSCSLYYMPRKYLLQPPKNNRTFHHSVDSMNVPTIETYFAPGSHPCRQQWLGCTCSGRLFSRRTSGHVLVCHNIDFITGFRGGYIYRTYRKLEELFSFIRLVQVIWMLQAGHFWLNVHNISPFALGWAPNY